VLQSDVPGQPIEVVLSVLEKELGPVDELFQSFETQPCGSASIGQAHRAVTIDGKPVLLKVKFLSISLTTSNRAEISPVSDHLSCLTNPTKSYAIATKITHHRKDHICRMRLASENGITRFFRRNPGSQKGHN